MVHSVTDTHVDDKQEHEVVDQSGENQVEREVVPVYVRFQSILARSFCTC